MDHHHRHELQGCGSGAVDLVHTLSPGGLARPRHRPRRRALAGAGLGSSNTAGRGRASDSAPRSARLWQPGTGRRSWAPAAPCALGAWDRSARPRRTCAPAAPPRDGMRRRASLRRAVEIATAQGARRLELRALHAVAFSIRTVREQLADLVETIPSGHDLPAFRAATGLLSESG